MPGIAGIISRQRPDACTALVERMTDCMQHEKFHTLGTHAAPELGIFAGWVALEASTTARQPVISEDANVALLLAGECFCDGDVQRDLKARGHTFEENTAAWVVHLYEESGDAFVETLNGLFSGLLIDKRRRKAFLFNDRYGMERVYYHEGRDGFFFASEAKALLRVLAELRAFDEKGLAQYLHYGCTWGGTTLFRDINLLPAASLWTFNDDKREKRHYFTPSNWESQRPLAADVFITELEQTFTRVLPRYFKSGGDIGISLTGGLDTRMIMACRPRATQQLVSYTFAGPSGLTLDAQLAARVATASGIPHHLIRIGSDFFSDFSSFVDRTVYMTDGSFGACGAHEIYLNRHARGLAPLRLTGNFGSEVLRSVTTLKPLGLSATLFEHNFRQTISMIEPPPSSSTTHPVSFAVFSEIPLHLFGVVRAAQSQVSWRTPYMDNEIVALAFRAPDKMRRSSSAALAAIRRNNSHLSRIRTDSGLVPASQVLSLVHHFWNRIAFKLDYWCGEGMPHWLSAFDTRVAPLGLGLWRPGLHSYLHYSKWFRTQLAGHLRERLTDTTMYRGALWNRAFLEQLADDHIAGRKNYVREINTVLTLDTIEQCLFRQPGDKKEALKRIDRAPCRHS
jgi:asparagine synthase (glutamine-hydrolysing)